MKLQELLQERMDSQGLSLRKAAESIEISHSTVDRALRGEKLDVDVMVKICKWLGVTLNDVVYEGYEPNPLYKKIAMILSIEQEFESLLFRIDQEIRNKRISPGLLREIAGYANYRIDQETSKK